MYFIIVKYLLVFIENLSTYIVFDFKKMFFVINMVHKYMIVCKIKRNQ